jgi:DNA-binding beta-propeller fold protein YncE
VIRRLWLPLLAATACGDVFVAPPRNLSRPSDVALVTDVNPTNESPEYAFVLDTERAQLIVVDAVLGILRDVHPAIPGYNGVFLGGTPSSVAALPDGRRVVVANGAGTLQVVCTPVDPECSVPSILQEISVGGRPERVAVMGSRAYVTRPHDGAVVEVDLDAGQVLGSIAVGGAPRGLAATPDGTRLYVANSELGIMHRITRTGGAPEISAVQTGFPTRSVFTSPNPAWVYALRSDLGTLLVIDPATDTVVNTNPDGPPEAGKDMVFPAPVDSVAFQTFAAGDNAAIGVGQFGYATTSNGFVYVFNTQGDDAHKIVDRAPPSTPSVTNLPTLTIGQTVITVTEAIPRILGYDQSPAYGITFSTGRRVVRTEGWGLTYEGLVPPAAPSPGRVLPGGILRNADVPFSELRVPGTGEAMVRDGDLLSFLQAPHGGAGADCSAMQYDANGALRLWVMTLIPDRPNEVRLAPRDPDPLPALEACYTEGLYSYIVRTAGTWAVVGTQSGYQGRARECPRTVPESACGEYTYSNPFFSLIMRQGTANSVPDHRWSFASTDGVSPARISLTTSSFLPAGLPTAIAASRRPERTLLVVDEGDDALAIVDAAALQILRVIR